METKHVPQKNSVGTAGFILAILALVFCWVPVLDFILWILGAVLSIVGIFKRPKGLAIAGTIISFLGLIIAVIVVAIAGVALF